MRSSKSLGRTEPEKFFIQKYLDGVIDVSENGLVYNTITARYIGAISTGRYPKISMARGPKDIVHIQIHRLVWLIYRGDIPEGIEINHKDGIKSNPSLDNLELMTPSQNSQHAVDSGFSPSISGHLNGNAKFSREQVEEIRKRYEMGERQIDIAKDLGVSRPTIGLIVNLKTYIYE